MALYHHSSQTMTKETGFKEKPERWGGPLEQLMETSGVPKLCFPFSPPLSFPLAQTQGNNSLNSAELRSVNTLVLGTILIRYNLH